jgi:DDE domain
VIEQDHRFIKKRFTASQGFRSAEGAWRTIEGYEAMHAISKGQIRWVGKGDAVGQRQLIHTIFGIAAWRDQQEVSTTARSPGVCNTTRDSAGTPYLSEQHLLVSVQPCDGNR